MDLVALGMPKCKTCGKGSDGEFCFQHKPRTPLKQCSITPSLTSKRKVNVGFTTQNLTSFVKKKVAIRQTSELRELFLHIWKKKPHKSEISGAYLGKEPFSTYFHHILPKEKYPQACMDEENIILLTLDEHSNVENDIYKYEIINEKRKQLKTKYNL